jgi:hypothetical protein
MSTNLGDAWMSAPDRTVIPSPKRRLHGMVDLAQGSKCQSHGEARSFSRLGCFFAYILPLISANSKE